MNTTRRQFLGAALLAGAAPCLLRGRALAHGDAENFFVFFDRLTGRTHPNDLGYCCSTYGPTPVDSPAQADAERSLDARLVRVPLTIKNGRVDSSAAGHAAGFDMAGLVNWYRVNGFSVYATLGGKTNDINYETGAATLVARQLGFDAIEYGCINEPNNHGLKVPDVLKVAQQSLADLRAVNPKARLWGPEWTWFAPDDLELFAREFGEGLAGVSYHHYGMGEKSLPTLEAMTQTPNWGLEVAQTRAALKALALPERVGVTELNLSWRFADGTPPDGRNRRFFRAQETVWAASVCGHILRQGGRALLYGSQNGAMGVWNQNPNDETDEIKRPQSSPMPAYWGLATWTGARLWPHFGDRFFDVAPSPSELPSDSEPPIEVFAVANEAGGANIVLINKNDHLRPARVRWTGPAPGKTMTLWQSDPSAPFDAFKARPSAALQRQFVVNLPPYSVAVVVVS